MGDLSTLPRCHCCPEAVAEFRDREGHDIACLDTEARRVRYLALVIDGPDIGHVTDWSGVHVCGKCFAEGRHLDFRAMDRRLAENNGPTIRAARAASNRNDPDCRTAKRMANTMIFELIDVQVPAGSEDGGISGRDWVSICCAACDTEWDSDLLRYVCRNCGTIHGNKARLFR